MRVKMSEARERLPALVDRAAAGEEIILTRRGKEVARLVPPSARAERLPSLEGFLEKIRVQGEALSRTVVREREEARY